MGFSDFSQHHFFLTTRISYLTTQRVDFYILTEPVIDLDPIKPIDMNGFIDLQRSTMNGEGGIRTHEGVTPTRFRVVRDQPDSATSPHALRRTIILKADETRAFLTLLKPASMLWRGLEAKPCSGEKLLGS